ncbi:MAG: nucleotidyltransferase family protein [Ruminococcus sp.]|nr:nucleotidyltransferase family protein [Ruminococcus sp.]HRR77987.1 nucleotidyltransferase family protein [Ruminococcus sp.]
MEANEYRKSAYDMLYLTACTVNGITPSAQRAASIDTKKLLETCEKHILTAAAAYGLEAAGIKDYAMTQAKEKAVRKNILLDAQRNVILKRLESEKIWYMPLKGALLKDWYPKLGMRQMSDNDILCDPEYREKIRDIMLELGFTVSHYGELNDDAYFKEPVYNYEMHFDLFTYNPENIFYNYYKDIRDRLIKDDDNSYGYHLSNENFYIYMLSHEHKHYFYGGTGVRSLLDIYVFIRKFGDELDWDYISEQLSILDMTDFEANCRELADKVFSLKKLSIEDKKALDYFIFSGTYGNQFNVIYNRVSRGLKKNKTAGRYVIQRIFPPMSHYKKWYPWAYEHKWLLPAAWLFRPLRGITVRRKRLAAELRYLLKKEK